jgi:proteasome lid subunit RPN8/RPN11
VKLNLPDALLVQLTDEAYDALPRECCGLIEGIIDSDLFDVRALHPARNDAAASGRFEIAPEDHFAASKTARANGHALIGCYHSHPKGKAAPSSSDLAGASEENFLWLIAAIDGLNTHIGAFVYRSSAFVPVALTTGADFVTSSLKERS